jgi:hypothetical protein
MVVLMGRLAGIGTVAAAIAGLAAVSDNRPPPIISAVIGFKLNSLSLRFIGPRIQAAS